LTTKGITALLSMGGIQVQARIRRARADEAQKTNNPAGQGGVEGREESLMS